MVLRPAQHKGFTLIELMVTIAIAAILLTIGVPSLTSFFDRQKVIAAAEDIYANIALAKSLAISSNQDVSFKLFNYDAATKGYFGVTDNTITDYASECRDGVTLADLKVGDMVYKVSSDNHEGVTYKIGGESGLRAWCVQFDNVRGAVTTFTNSGAKYYVDITYDELDMRVNVSQLGRISICSNDVGGYLAC